MTVQVAHALRPCPGEVVSGDAVVFRSSGPNTVFGVIDALGHGPVAAKVARMALSFLDQVDLALPMREMVEGLHRALTHTRGAASGLCVARCDMVELSIVGNVTVRSLGTRVGVLASPGILGRHVRKLRCHRAHLRPGDRLVVFSDGLSRVELEPIRRLEPAQACENLLRNHARSSDDASVVVADF